MVCVLRSGLAQIVIEFIKSDDDDTLLKPPVRMLMYLPGKSQLTVKDLLALSQVKMTPEIMNAL